MGALWDQREFTANMMLFLVYFLVFSIRHFSVCLFYSQYFSPVFFSVSRIYKSFEVHKENVCLATVSGNSVSSYLSMLLE